MPIDPRTEFTFHFDEHGRMRLENTAKSLEFLDEIEKHQELQIVLGVTDPVPPNYTVDCGEEKPPQPNKVIGCLNTLCPMEIKVRISKLVQDERTRVVDERSLGSASGGGG